MDPRLLAMPLLIAMPAVLIFAATLGLNAVAKRAARRHADRARFTPAERARLRALRAQHREEMHDRSEHPAGNGPPR